MDNSTKFVIKNKVALVTGGASGIGYCLVKELLRNGAKGVTIVDFNKEQGERALSGIQNEFGKDKAIFVLCDVVKIDQLERAFQKAVDTFKALDIVVNNAGVADGDDFHKCVSVNLIGVINGITLAVNTYLPKYKSGDEGLVLNTASTAFVLDVGFYPVYAATKAAVVSLTRSWGFKHIYEKSKIRVIAICPGITSTPLLTQFVDVPQPVFKDSIEKRRCSKEFLNQQTPEQVAQNAIKIIQTAPSSTIWILEKDEMPFEYKFPSRESFKSSK